jgi:hypothetical protein
MKNFTKRIGKIIYFPLFLPALGILAVLFLASNNLGQSSLSSIWSSLAIALIISVFILGICKVLIQPASRAYLAAFFLLTAFFIYGHILNILKGKTISGIELGKNSIFLPIFLILVIAGFVYILRKPPIKAFPTPVFNFARIMCISNTQNC